MLDRLKYLAVPTDLCREVVVAAAAPRVAVLDEMFEQSGEIAVAQRCGRRAAREYI